MKVKIFLIVLLMCISNICFSQTISERLIDINSSKNAIKNAIETKNVTVADAPLASYSLLILDIVGEDAAEFAAAIKNIRQSISDMGVFSAFLTPLNEIYLDVLEIEAHPATKESIRLAIENKGVFVFEGERLASYPEFIAMIDEVNIPDFPSIKILPDVELGEAVATSGTLMYLTGNVVGSNTYEKTANPDTNPSGTTNSVSTSADGQYLAVAHAGTSAPARLVTYKWSEVNNRYEKTANPDTAPSGQAWSTAMSADGQYLAVGHMGGGEPPNLITYKWSEVNNRYEKTANPDTPPSGIGYGCDMSADGQYLAVGHTGAGAPARLITYKWSEVNNRYEKTANPDTAPPGLTYSVSMSADGQYLAVAHTGTWQSPPNLITYKWSEVNNRYEKTANPDTPPSGQGRSTTMSADGQYLAVGHDGTSPPARLITYKWSEVNNRYEKTDDPDTTPLGSVEFVDMSADGQYLAAAIHHGDPPFLKVYKWNNNNNRYEEIIINSDPTNYCRGLSFTSSGGYLSVGVSSSVFTYKLNQISYNDWKLYSLDVSNPLVLSIPQSAWAVGWTSGTGAIGDSLNLNAWWWNYYLDD